MNKIDQFFNPKSVAVVGVSEDPGKLGAIIFNNMLDAGFTGKLYPVNPKYTELFWHKVYSKVSEIQDEVELVVIVVPAKFILGVMEDAGHKGVKAVIIISAGFKETGVEGAELERQILAVAEKFEMKIIGPNCLGVIVPENGLNASFAASTPKPGNIAFLSQSGAYCTAILDMAVPANLGFSHFISFGNKVDIDEIDLLEELLPNKNVKVIGAYLEEIKKGQKFMKVLSNSKHSKPFIILKAGQTDEAKKAILSHTGAMAGSTQIYKTAFEQTGIIEAKSLRDMYNLMMAFSWCKLSAGNRVGIITNAGGPGIVTTDLVVKSGLKMAELSANTISKLKANLPATANVYNPVDLVGDALADRYQVTVQALAEDSDVDSILIIITPQLITQIEETAKIIINAIKVYNKPIIPILLGEKYMAPAVSRFFDNKFVAFKDINDAVDVLSSLVSFTNFKEQSYNKTIIDNTIGIHTEELQKHIGRDGALPDELVEKFATEVGLSLPKQRLCFSLDEAIEFAKDIYPVVIKASNTAVIHKTDIKAIYLDQKEESDLRAAYTVLEQTIREKVGINKVGILVQEQIDYEEQLFVGATRDGEADVYAGNAGFGHLLVFGQGGIYTEIQHDLGYALVPTSKDYIYRKLESTRVFTILNGARGKDPLAIDEFVNVVYAIQKLVLLYPAIKSIDINPVLITKKKAIAVDIKIFV